MVIAGIVAGGIGSRMGQSVLPKQFLELGGKPIVIHTLEKFLASPDVDAVVIGVHKDWVQMMNDLIEKYCPNNANVAVVVGGADRNGTIKNIVVKAKEAFHADENTILVTHDAVRPFVSLRIIKENVEAVERYGACDTVIEATDTIVESTDADKITDVPVRKHMYQGQTPQSFRMGAFETIYDDMTEEELSTITDACKLFFLRGYPVHLVKGEVTNFKVTYPFDLKMAYTLIGEQ